MSSIFTSDETILEVKGLDIVFSIEYYRSTTLRDKFTSFVHDPINSMFAPPNRLHVIKNFNLTLKKGERVGILGVNGTGKTSLCRCIAGMYEPNRGEVNIKGNVRAIFDTGVGILPELSGRENAKLLAQLLYPNIKNRSELIQEALDFSELNDFIDTPYKFYSKGMQARLCLALISAVPCDLLIVDEVFDGADIFFQKKISERILNMIHQSGAVLFVTHTLTQLERACNRVVVIDNHELVFDGSVEEGIKYYESLSLTKPFDL